MALEDIQYIPSPIIPEDPEGLVKYLQEELDKIAFTFNNNTISEESDIEEGEVIEAQVHAELEQRDAPNAHPMDSITGLVFDQARQDLDIAQRARVFFQETQPTDEESSQGDLWFKEGWD